MCVLCWQTKKQVDAEFIKQRELKRADRDNYTHAQIRTILPPKEAHHDKHLTAYQLLRRFPEGIHTAIVMRDEHIATLPKDMSMMNHITKIDVAGNNIIDLSLGLVNLPSLSELDVSNNLLTVVFFAPHSAHPPPPLCGSAATRQRFLSDGPRHIKNHPAEISP